MEMLSPPGSRFLKRRRLPEFHLELRKISILRRANSFPARSWYQCVMYSFSSVASSRVARSARVKRLQSGALTSMWRLCRKKSSGIEGQRAVSSSHR